MKTYQIGMLQSKAYRILNKKTNDLLKPFGISALEWAFLGILYDTPEGMRLGVMAKAIGVKTPLTTVIADDLAKKKMIRRKNDPKDRRAKLLVLTPLAHNQVPIIEQEISHQMKKFLKNSSDKDISGYIATLHLIVHNFSRKA